MFLLKNIFSSYIHFIVLFNGFMTVISKKSCPCNRNLRAKYTINHSLPPSFPMFLTNYDSPIGVLMNDTGGLNYTSINLSRWHSNLCRKIMFQYCLVKAFKSSILLPQCYKSHSQRYQTG